MHKIDSFRSINFQIDARQFSVKTVETDKTQQNRCSPSAPKKSRQIASVQFLFQNKIKVSQKISKKRSHDKYSFSCIRPWPLKAFSNNNTAAEPAFQLLRAKASNMV